MKAFGALSDKPFRAWKQPIFPIKTVEKKEVALCTGCGKEPVHGKSKYGLDCKAFRMNGVELPWWLQKK